MNKTKVVIVNSKKIIVDTELTEERLLQLIPQYDQYCRWYREGLFPNLKMSSFATWVKEQHIGSIEEVK